jgi:hypothetical protein
MMLLVASAIVASLAAGVVIAYGVCSALLTVFRLHARTNRPAPLPMRTKTARP